MIVYPIEVQLALDLQAQFSTQSSYMFNEQDRGPELRYRYGLVPVTLNVRCKFT